MPIYEYACRNCDHYMDALQKMSDEPLVDCPECGEPQLRRMISAPRFRLKGQGWYETDFKKENQRNLSSGDSSTSTSADKSESAKAASSESSGKAASSESSGKATSSESTGKAESKKSEPAPVKSSTSGSDGS